MLVDLENHKANVVIVKDLSRFGREYAQMGMYIENDFEDWNIRFISIGESIDTLNGTDGILMPITNVINSQYAKECSRKTKQAHRALAKEGKFIGSKAPFGYAKDPNDRHHLIVDEEAAAVVKSIFKMFCDGIGFVKMTKILREQKILNPQAYFNRNNPGYYQSDYWRQDFPDNFSGDDKENVINSYLDSNDVNPNYLKLIIDSNPSKQLPFSDKTKLKAKRLYNKFAEEVFSNESKGHKYGVEVIFDEKLDDVMKTEYIDSVYRITYGTNYLKESLDYPSLLNNFIYLFEYTDLQFRSNWYLRKSNLGIFESILGIRGKTVYNVGVSFNLLNMLSLSQISIYSAFLNRNNIVIENVIKWFFEEYLKEEFSVNNYCFNVPSQNISFSEKCKLLLIELESILKQFKCFVEDGEIDRELLEISSKHLKFESIPSMIKDKYLYLNEKVASTLTYILFSDQSGLSYIDKFQDKYEYFAKLMFNERINISDFNDVQKSRIKILDSASIIKINDNGDFAYEENKILLLHDLYKNEVSRKSYVYKMLSYFSDEEIENYYQFGSTLFSRPEQAYLNYMLNNAEFSNGLALRNKYLHGTGPNNSEKNVEDYYQILKIIIFIVIKINEEFCAKSGDIYA